MSKFSNVVKFQVKADAHAAFRAAFASAPDYDGLHAQFLIETGPDTYCSCGIWTSMDDLVKARPLMIGFLDTVRDLLVELSPELGVTDAVSGDVLFETGLA